MLNGECRSAGGIVTGSCSSITRQAVCCICEYASVGMKKQRINIKKIKKS